MTIPLKCEVCGHPAYGFLTVRFYGDSRPMPYEAISEIPSCLECSNRDIWSHAVGDAAIRLSGQFGKVISYGSEASRVAKERHVRSKGYDFEWCPRIYVGLTPFGDERVEKMVQDAAQREKDQHLQTGGKLQ